MTLENLLTIAGIMLEEMFGDVVRANLRLTEMIRQRGFPFHDILYTPLCFTCDFLPSVQ